MVVLVTASRYHSYEIRYIIVLRPCTVARDDIESTWLNSLRKFLSPTHLRSQLL